MRDFHHHLLLFLYLFLLSLYQVTLASSLSTAPKAAHHRCRDDQRSAFAQLQENLKFPESFSKAELWDLKTDCCSWEGVTCNDAGHATQLDLSFASGEDGDSVSLEKPNLGMLFQNLSFLVELHLDYVNISAQGSNWCEVISKVLPNLRVLSLSNSSLSGPLCSSLLKLHFLSELDLSQNPELSSISPSFLVNSSNLETLDLSYCGLNGSFPNNIFRFPKLQSIDLSENLLLSGQLPEFSLNSSIQSLSLKNTNFTGNIPLSISNLKSLNYLDLSRCKFYGLGDFKNQRDLVFLALSGVSVESDNRSLAYVQLATLYLPNCNLTEFPNFLKKQNSLTGLDLSNNRIQGYVPSWIWKTTLTTLYLSRNPVDFPKTPPFVKVNHSTPIYNEDGVSSFHIMLEDLRMSSCNITGSFPEFIRNQEKLQNLDLSDNKLSGQIPKWIWNISLAYLNLSCNNFDFLDQFSTPISLPYSDTLITLDLHANQLPGSFPKAICNCSQLSLLDMSHNRLGSQIPDLLHVMDLSSNEFTGNLLEELVQSLAGMKVTTKNESRARYVGDNYNINGYYKESASSKQREMVQPRPEESSKVGDQVDAGECCL
ncbi:LEUCINE-RICH REPEAT RECEPTOR PROTEIN KINASE EMS1-LIKE-RELATED [Salix purpurea]|uniref:LEUCINE-RICH REPEAT RECEPTOR PROTEIN KINASE EMS1-LIKE-RELATED n=1 Tax=Salix purpurea TaxID=77065 RepID=A0A9Q0WMV7_SALPP|nr:LEUCINE-RICH REPEAT RECEPTOR PROTEIN KINASE EMS1-LIKE-RELATED [Salix purpurea]